eukprot:4392916-Prymnesium_polylepis.3
MREHLVRAQANEADTRGTDLGVTLAKVATKDWRVTERCLERAFHALSVNAASEDGDGGDAAVIAHQLISDAEHDGPTRRWPDARTCFGLSSHPCMIVMCTKGVLVHAALSRNFKMAH